VRVRLGHDRFVIRTESTTTATAATVHELLVDVDAWSLWSPHVASVSSDRDRVEAGWVGETRALFAPTTTTMVVDEVRPEGGYRWHSTVGPWRLDYDNLVLATPQGCTVRFTAELAGPAATVLERLVAPFSALGQRRRIARLIKLAELVEGKARTKRPATGDAPPSPGATGARQPSTMVPRNRKPPSN